MSDQWPDLEFWQCLLKFRHAHLERLFGAGFQLLLDVVERGGHAKAAQWIVHHGNDVQQDEFGAKGLGHRRRIFGGAG